jgi:hypothetical protein
MSKKHELNITQTHINTLQNIISRLSNYSANCKTWTITLVSALALVLLNEENEKYFFLLIFPILMFWIIDCYYLGLEKVFREIYDKFQIDLNSASKIESDIKFTLKGRRLNNFFRAMISLSTTPIYFSLFILLYSVKYWIN